MVSPVHLRTVAAVVRTGSFADAARELRYTSSAVSQQVSQLERTLQVTLFEREAQRIRPTPAAEYLASRSVEALALLDALTEDMRGIAEGLVGLVRLGSFPTASKRILPGAIARYVRKHSEVRIALDEEEPEHLIARLQSGELDLALVYWYDPVPRRWPEGLVALELLHEELVILLPERHAARDRAELRLEQFRDSTWICTREGTAGAASFVALCRGAGFDPIVTFRSNDYEVINQFVHSGLGVALVPSLSLSAAQLQHAARLTDVGARRNVLVLYRESNANPALEGMLTALRGAVSEVVASRDLLVRAAPAKR